MGKLHPELEDYQYWDLRLRLFEIQKLIPGYDEIQRDLLEDLTNYLKKETDPWEL